MATSSKKKTFVNKDDLKRLMKEKKNSLNVSKKKIDSPLAKYDSLGQLHCALCGCKVKTDLLWNAHINGRTHKENLAHLKEQQNRKIEERLHAPAVERHPEKRKLPAEPQTANKIQKVHSQGGSSSKSDQSALPPDFFDNDGGGGGGGLANLGGYDDSDGSDSEDKTGSASTNRKSNVSGGGGGPSVEGLPADFFDAGIPVSREDSSKAQEEDATSASKSMAEQLPEGFFDDAKQDAKVRQVEYKDKMEEEWEMFQRAMKEENQVSEALQEEDNETVQVERNIKEIDEQIYHWSKVEELHQKKEQVMSTQKSVEGEQTSARHSDSDTDDEDFQEFLDWRSKKVH